MACRPPAGSRPQIGPANSLVGLILVLPGDFRDNSSLTLFRSVRHSSNTRRAQLVHFFVFFGTNPPQTCSIDLGESGMAKRPPGAFVVFFFLDGGGSPMEEQQSHSTHQNSPRQNGFEHMLVHGWPAGRRAVGAVVR